MDPDLHAALAVGEDIEYVRVRAGEEVLVMARDLVERVLGEDAEVLSHFPGAALAGTRYEPPFGYISDYGPRGHSVLLGDFVTTEDGTGIVHTAIAFGEDDFRLGEQYGITLQNPVLADGTFDERVPDFAGRKVKEADPDIIEALRASGPPADLGLRALLSALLALRNAAPLLREGELRTSGRPRSRSGCWPRTRPSAGAPSTLKHGRFGRWLEGNMRLGPLARALLGHTAADLGVHERRLRGQLLRRVRSRVARARRRGARRPAPALHKSTRS